jgi:hypothetical protein
MCFHVKRAAVFGGVFRFYAAVAFKTRLPAIADPDGPNLVEIR